MMKKDRIHAKKATQNATGIPADIVIEFEAKDREGLAHFQKIVVKRLLEDKVGAKEIDVFLNK